MGVLMLLDYVGYFAPVILFFSSILFLFNKKTYLAYYITGTILNVGINIILKIIIKDPRPDQDVNLFQILMNNGQRVTFNRFGMPSGHAQMASFSLIYIYLVTKNMTITNFYLIVFILTLYQRIKYNNHTKSQLLVGTITGLSVGYLCYYLSNKNIMGKIKEKKDDNGPR